jgi:hypothetical protein
MTTRTPQGASAGRSKRLGTGDLDPIAENHTADTARQVIVRLPGDLPDANRRPRRRAAPRTVADG